MSDLRRSLRDLSEQNRSTTHSAVTKELQHVETIQQLKVHFCSIYSPLFNCPSTPCRISSNRPQRVGEGA